MPTTGGGGGTGKGNIPPTVSLSASPTTVQINSATTLTANAADTDGTIAKVEFYNGATLLSTDTTSPYSATYHAHGGRHVHVHGEGVRQRRRGRSRPAAVNVTATTAPAGSTAPRITMALSNTTNQPNTLVTPGTVVTVSGSPVAIAPATVARVSFYMNGAKLVDETSSPYNTTVTLPDRPATTTSTLKSPIRPGRSRRRCSSASS